MFYFSNYSEVFHLQKHQEIWLHLNFFQSAETVQIYLKNCYGQLDTQDGKGKATVIVTHSCII